jgi:hypothetical protein
MSTSSDPCRDGACPTCDADPPEPPNPMPPCCAAAVAAEVALVITRYNESWKTNLALITADHYERGYADAEAGRERRGW